MSIVDMMLAARANILKVKQSGGHFYFLADQNDAALMIHTNQRDKDGKRTMKDGRKLLNTFKAEKKSRPKFCHGTVDGGDILTFLIKKGTIKPSQMKKLLKNNQTLHTGAGNNAHILKTAKVKMAGQPESSAPVDDAKLETFKNRPDIAELKLSPQELHELFLADTAFDTYQEQMKIDEEEELKLEYARAALSDKQNELRLVTTVLKSTPANTAEALKNQRKRRLQLEQMAHSSPIGGDPFSSAILPELTGTLFAACHHSDLLSIYSRTQMLYSNLCEIRRMTAETLDDDQRAQCKDDVKYTYDALQQLQEQKKLLS